MRHSFSLRKILVIGGLVLFAFTVSFVIAMGALNFTKHPGPVLSYGVPGAWDDFSVSSGSVLIDEGMYKMWYVGTDGSSYTSAFGYATSNDGITWTKYSDNPVFEGTPGGWDAHLNSVKVIKVGDTYLMYYGGGASGSSPSRIGLATSLNGIHWTSYAGNPILTSGPTGNWDEYYVGGPSVIYDGSLFHMWYLGTQGGPHRIGYATSTNGINWTKSAGNYPVLAGNTSFQIDYATIPEVVWDGHQYVMFYMSVAIGSSNSSTWVAFSDDGVNWQQEAVPVLTGENPAEWDHLYDISSGRAVVNDGKYKLWYNTYDGTHGRIGYAEASLERLTVAIDIKPGSNDNPIDLKSNGVIPVAILTTNDFDATTVDPLSVEFGPNRATEAHHKGHIEDADGDGDLDLVLHFRTQNAGIQCGDTEASLAGKTFDNLPIVGTDAIQTVGCGLAKLRTDEEIGLPEGYALSQNYPNPFNPETEIRFQLPEASQVVVKIFNIVGEEIRILVNAPYEAGYHSIRWDGKDKNGNSLSSGIYLYELQTSHFRQIKKMSLLR